MKGVGTVAAMYECHQKNVLLATAFWDLVLTESHESVKDGSRVLALFLRDALTTRKPGTNSPKWAPRAFYVKCIHAANAWKSGYSTDLKYHEASPLPALKW